MTDFIKASNSFLQCTKCEEEFKIKGNVHPANGMEKSGGCLAYGTCPHCGHEACANRDTLECKPSTLEG